MTSGGKGLWKEILCSRSLSTNMISDTWPDLRGGKIETKQRQLFGETWDQPDCELYPLPPWLWTRPPFHRFFSAACWIHLLLLEPFESSLYHQPCPRNWKIQGWEFIREYEHEQRFPHEKLLPPWWLTADYCIRTLPRGGMYFPMHPDSRQCTSILSALAGKYWFCGVFSFETWKISLTVHRLALNGHCTNQNSCKGRV